MQSDRDQAREPETLALQNLHQRRPEADIQDLTLRASLELPLPRKRLLVLAYQRKRQQSPGLANLQNDRQGP